MCPLQIPNKFLWSNITTMQHISTQDPHTFHKKQIFCFSILVDLYNSSCSTAKYQSCFERLKCNLKNMCVGFCKAQWEKQPWNAYDRLDVCDTAGSQNSHQQNSSVAARITLHGPFWQKSTLLRHRSSVTASHIVVTLNQLGLETVEMFIPYFKPTKKSRSGFPRPVGQGRSAGQQHVHPVWRTRLSLLEKLWDSPGSQ